MMTRRVLIAGAAPLLAAQEPASPPAFGNRGHIFARPSAKEKMIWCFSTVLGCGDPAVLKVPALAEPILAWRFPGGGSLSVEFTEKALDESRARYGAWMEIQTANPDALKKKILDAGLTQVHYPVTNTFYFMVPGGQVLGIVSGKNPSAGELKNKP
jgi:hypothetical protein